MFSFILFLRQVLFSLEDEPASVFRIFFLYPPFLWRKCGRKWWLKTYGVFKVVSLLFFFTDEKLLGMMPVRILKQYHLEDWGRHSSAWKKKKGPERVFFFFFFFWHLCPLLGSRKCFFLFATTEKGGWWGWVERGRGGREWEGEGV